MNSKAFFRNISDAQIIWLINNNSAYTIFFIVYNSSTFMLEKMVIIAAISDNNIIGKDGQIPWHISEDLKRFKKLTSGHSIIMGRRTFESIGRPLPKRENYVVSRSGLLEDGTPIAEKHPTIHVYKNIDEVLSNVDGKAYIIGGAGIYAATLPLANELELTRVRGNFAGDTYFPEFDLNEWVLTDEDKRDGYSFQSYKRKRGDE